MSELQGFETYAKKINSLNKITTIYIIAKVYIRLLIYIDIQYIDIYINLT